METIIISNRKTNFLSKISRADDEKIIKNIVSANFVIALVLFAGGLFSEVFYAIKDGEVGYFGFVMAFGALVFMVLSIVQMKKKGRTIFILDRIQGKIILPKNIYNNELKIYHVSNIRIDVINNEVYYIKEDGDLYLMNNILNNVITHETFMDDWNFIFWYMDKNRPLPTGDAFDEYRKKDYQRRKSEGFPPFFYRSVYSTLEYKKEWQEERDKHWREIIEEEDEGHLSHSIWQSTENLAKHGEWQEVVPQ